MVLVARMARLVSREHVNRLYQRRHPDWFDTSFVLRNFLQIPIIGINLIDAEFGISLACNIDIFTRFVNG